MTTAGDPSRQLNSADARREIIEAQLARILASPVFRRAEGLARMLRFIVDRTVEGDRASLKEYCVAVEVFRRADDFDPKDFALVRVQGTRLRKKLDAYYRAWGSEDPVLITVPRGGYAAHFEPRPARDIPPAGLDAALAADAPLVPEDRNGAECLARARHLLQQWDHLSLLRCAALCRQAARLGIDAPGLRGVAALSLAGLYWYDQLPPWEIVPAARAAAMEALGDSPVEARAALAYIAWIHDRDRDAVQRHLRAAAHVPGGFLSAIAAARRACGAGAGGTLHFDLALESVAPPVAAALRGLRFLAADPAGALTHFQAAAALGPSPFRQWCLGACLIDAGRPAEAAAPLLAAVQNDRGTLASSTLAYACAAGGRGADALRILERMQASAKTSYVSGIDLARVHAGLGQTSEALRHLQAADRQRSGRIFSALLAPEFAGLRHTRAFQRLLSGFREACLDPASVAA